MEMTTRSRKKVKAGLKSLQPLCGECTGFKKDILIEGNKHPCSLCDKTETSKACTQFLADPEPLQPLIAKGAFTSVVSLMKEIPDAGLRNFASMIYNEKKTRSLGFHFGQKVYVRYRGASNRNYLSNFMIAYIFTVNREFMRFTSKDLA